MYSEKLLSPSSALCFINSSSMLEKTGAVSAVGLMVRCTSYDRELVPDLLVSVAETFLRLSCFRCSFGNDFRFFCHSLF